MRIFAALLALALCSLSLTARAETILFLSSDPGGAELQAGLDLELRGYGMLVALRPSAEAFTSDARAASALSAARAVDAAAALWLEGGEPPRVRVVRASTGEIREAPLPGTGGAPDVRTFAAVAGSLVLEALDRAAPSEPPAALAAPASEPLAAAFAEPGGLVHNPLTKEYKPGSGKREARRRGFFLTLGASFGFVLLRPGKGNPDRPPTQYIDDVAEQARLPDSSLDVQRASQLLRERGFDCDAADAGEGALRISNCTVAIASAGYAMNMAVEGAIGLTYERLSLALTARGAPSAGHGGMAHLLIGVELRALLTGLRDRGAFLELVGGAGVGQIQGRPSGPSSGPYVQSGPAELRGGVRFGYRFADWLGLYGAMLVHGFFPDRATVLDPSLGLEVRR